MPGIPLDNQLNLEDELLRQCAKLKGHEELSFHFLLDCALRTLEFTKAILGIDDFHELNGILKCQRDLLIGNPVSTLDFSSIDNEKSDIYALIDDRYPTPKSRRSRNDCLKSVIERLHVINGDLENIPIEFYCNFFSTFICYFIRDLSLSNSQHDNELIWQIRRIQWLLESSSKVSRLWLLYGSPPVFRAPYSAQIHWRLPELVEMSCSYGWGILKIKRNLI